MASLSLHAMLWHSIIPFLLCCSLLFFSELLVRPPQTAHWLFCVSLFLAICKASSDNHFAFLHLFFLGDDLDHCLLYNVLSLSLQFFRHSYLSDIIPWIYLSLRLYNHKDLILVIPECSSGFPHFLQFKSEFGNKEFMIWATGNSQVLFLLTV